MAGAEHAARPAGLTAGAFTALVLAASRPGGDPVARAAGVAHKALAPVAGVAMLTRVVTALRQARAVRRVVVCGLDAPALAAEPALHELVVGGHIGLATARATPAASVLAAMREIASCTPLLVTTADHPLLTPVLVDDFCARSADAAADVTVGLVAARLVHGAFPALRRTTVPFRDGAYCGCNLFGFLTPAAERAAAEWMAVERHRKQPWRMVWALGVGVTLRFLLRRLTVEATTDLASARMGVRVRPILLAEAAAGFDVDTPAQLAMAEAFLRSRAATSEFEPQMNTDEHR